MPLAGCTSRSPSPVSTSVGTRTRREPGKARPERTGGQLVRVAEERRRIAEARLGQRRHALQQLPVGRAGERSRPLVQRARVVADRHRDQRQRLGRSRQAAPAAGGAGERQPADAVGRVVGELLRDDSAEGEAEDVGLFVAELVEQLGEELRHRRNRQRPARSRRASGARQLDRDRVRDSRQLLLEGHQHLDAGAEAVDQEQGASLAALPHEHLDAARTQRRVRRACARSHRRPPLLVSQPRHIW